MTVVALDIDDVLLRDEGHLVNHERLYRLYREEKLTVRKRGGRKRAIGTRTPMFIPTAANDRWSLDFVSDQLTDGRRFRVLTTRMPNAKSSSTSMVRGLEVDIWNGRFYNVRPER